MEQAQGFYKGWQSQRQLENQWQQAIREVPVSTGSARPPDKEKSLKPASKSRRGTSAKPKVHLADWPLTRLISERMKLDATVVEGISEGALSRGPGHDPHSSPLGGGNCVIAAHRNMAGWWFYRLDALRPGDRLTLVTPRQIFTYRLEKVREVPANDTSMLRAPRDSKARLTLYSCTLPKTDKRLVATAILQSQ